MLLQKRVDIKLLWHFPVIRGQKPSVFPFILITFFFLALLFIIIFLVISIFLDFDFSICKIIFKIVIFIKTTVFFSLFTLRLSLPWVFFLELFYGWRFCCSFFIFFIIFSFKHFINLIISVIEEVIFLTFESKSILRLAC